MKNQLGEMKVQIDWALGDIWNVKMQMCELKQLLCEGNKTWDMGCSVVPVVCVGVVMGMAVTITWQRISDLYISNNSRI
jgi:hypothetical protein